MHETFFCQNFHRIIADKCTDGALWRYCESMHAFMHGTHISKYVLKREKKSGCHGTKQRSMPIFMTLYTSNKIV